MNRLPVRNAEIVWVQIDGDVVAVDRRSGEVHRLQGAAAIVWLLLDGGPIGDLPAALSEHFGIEAGQAALDITQALELFWDARLVRDP